MLALTHDSSCVAAAFDKDLVEVDQIETNKTLKPKFNAKTSQISKFYGCYTSEFAKKWHAVFGVPAAGAEEKIDFGVVNRPSNISNVLERIEKTPTSVGNPDWTEYR